MPKKTFRILLGEEVQKPEYTEKRDCYQELASYMSGNSLCYGKVCALYGLRTGKTVMMMQYIADMNEAEKRKTAYILCAENADMLDLEECMDHLIVDGRCNFFLDEITLIENFQARANVLSDYYAVGNRKIVLAGTDSLGIRLAMADKLYDRAITIHTSHISYAEYSRLLKGNSLDEYIEYGGTLTNTTYKDIIYNGSTQMSAEDPTIQYLNAERFLCSIHEMSGIEETAICVDDLFQMPEKCREIRRRTAQIIDQ